MAIGLSACNTVARRHYQTNGQPGDRTRVGKEDTHRNVRAATIEGIELWGLAVIPFDYRFNRKIDV